MALACFFRVHSFRLLWSSSIIIRGVFWYREEKGGEKKAENAKKIKKMK